MTSRFELVLLPGLGADGRQYGPQRVAFPDLVVPPWIPAKKSENLSDYALRLAEGIAPRRPVVLGGSSLGGMVACEMAGHLKPDAVVLIGSCRSPHAIRPSFRALRPLLAVAPALAFDVARLLAPLAVGALHALPRRERRLCIAMFKAADSSFMRWAVQAVLAWRPGPLEAVPVFHIHGERDALIPARRVRADEIVSGGGHMINLTHAERVNAFVKKAFALVG